MARALTAAGASRTKTTELGGEAGSRGFASPVSIWMTCTVPFVMSAI
jgi:hypothetical protein